MKSGPAIATVATYDHLHTVLNLVRSIRQTWSLQLPIYVGLLDWTGRERPGFEAVRDVEFVPATALGVPDFWWQAAKFGPADLCCVLKPYVLGHVLARGHDAVVYCDSDVQFFDDGRALVEHAPEADVVMVPHMTTPFPAGSGDDRPTMADVGNAGIMNGGLLVLRRRPAALAFLEVWGRLCTTTAGYFLPEYGNPTEQQALNWAFAHVERVAVFRDRRFNIAYWNLHERPLRWCGLDGGPEDRWTLDGRPIVCFHFSALAWPERRLSRHENRHQLALNVNVWALCRHYHERLLAAHAAHYATAGYEHAEVDGRRVPPEVREELRRLEGFAAPRVEAWADVPGALRQLAHAIGRRSLLPTYLERVLEARGDLQQLDPPHRVYRIAFVQWAERYLRHDYACGLLLEHYTDTAFELGPIRRLSGEIARGPSGLSAEEAAHALVTDRPALIERLRRDYPRPEMLEAIEAGTYRFPAFDPALCLRLVYERRADLREAFPDPLGSDLTAFRKWLEVFLPREFSVPERVTAFAATLDPPASLARLLAHAQRADAWRDLVSARGLGAWMVPDLVHMLPHAPGYEASDIVVVGWWLERHQAEGRALVDRTFVPPLDTPGAGAYLEWWCRRNLEGAAGDAEIPASRPLAACADGVREFARALRRALDPAAPRVPAFVRACERARLELSRSEARRLLASRLAPDPCGINVFGYFKSPIGLGAQSWGLAAACERAGYHTRRIVLTNATMDAALAPEDLHPDFGFAFPRNLVVTYPHIQHDNFAAFPREFFEGRETSAHVAWEQRDLHPLWADALRPYDRLFAPSRFAAEAIARATGRPCEPVANVVTVDPTATERWPRAAFGLPPDTFVVGLVFDATSSVERKNPLAAVRAVGAALAGCRAVLVVKIAGGSQGRFAPLVRALAEEAGRHRLEHRLITETMPKARVDALIAGCDLYVSLHRAEGFGYTLAEAMLLGVPVVATGHSGNMDFMTADNSYPVAWREAVVDRPEGPFQLGTVWAEPELDDAVEQVRRVYTRPDEAKARAARARADVEALASVDAVARRLRALFGDPARTSTATQGDRPA